MRRDEFDAVAARLEPAWFQVTLRAADLYQIRNVKLRHVESTSQAATPGYSSSTRLKLKEFGAGLNRSTDDTAWTTPARDRPVRGTQQPRCSRGTPTLPSQSAARKILAMSAHFEDLKQLPLSERLQLVEDLWDSIASDLETAPLPESLQAEMDRRLQAYLKNPSRSLSLEEVQRRMKGGR